MFLRQRTSASIFVAAIGAALLVALGSSAEGADTSSELYRWRVAATSVPVTNIQWTFDTATWELKSGTLHYLEPTANGAVTGVVFEGTGRFKMTVPDPFEQKQLARFAEEPSLEAIDTTFERMVLRVGGQLPAALPAPPESADSESNGTLRNRHERWLLVAARDVRPTVGHAADPLRRR